MKKKKSAKKIIKDIFIILLPMIIALGGYFIYDQFIRKPSIPSVDKIINEKKKNNYSDKDKNKKNIKDYVNRLPDYRAQYGNQNIMGILDIPNINMDNILITRTNNNTYYLNYNLYGQWDGLGVPFFDYRNTSLNTDRQINIYGHNTQRTEFYSQLPFINLEVFADKNMFDNYKDVYLSIDERQIHYEIVAVKILTDGSNEHMKVKFKSDEDFLQHVNKLLSGSLYTRESATFTAEDHLLVLQVCHYNPMGSYLLVFCKEQEE